jgi:hypothetical protein
MPVKPKPEPGLMRRLRGLGLVLVAALLLAGHIYTWYMPRARPAAPKPGGLPARLLAAGAAGSYDACFWVPYPHQNLGVLRNRLEDGAAWLDAVARVADLPPPVLPGFGPFALPPSSEIAACSDLSGHRFFLVADVYPTLAAVARLSGKLADNPWLAGGEVREAEGDSPEERVLRVAWREGMWTVTSGEDVPDLRRTSTAATPAKTAQDAPALPESFGLFRLFRGISDLPTGDYLLRRQGDDLEVTLARADAVPAPELPADLTPVLLAVAGPSWPAAEPKPLPPAAFAIFDIGEEGKAEGRAAFGSLGALPGIAVFHPPGGQRWEVPTQGLAGLLTGSLPRGDADGWQILAIDAASLTRAKALAPRLSTLTPPDGGTPPGQAGRLVLGLWVRPAPAVRLVSRVRKFFEKVPVVEQRQSQRWRDWETLLRPLAPCDRIALAATQTPPSFRLRFHGCAGPHP